MSKPKISVIIPVYNVENYIEKCLNSVFNQTYENLEVIVVNDCSTDNSLKVVKKLISKQSNVILINNEKNMGLSFSRNIGLKKSTGNYIGFLDSDDYIDSNYYESMLNMMLKDKSEICVCDINTVFEDSNNVIRTKCGNTYDDKLDFINNGLAASACNKLFKRELIINEEFPVGKINEDVSVILPLMIKSKKCSYVDDTCYNYLQRKKSIQNNSFSLKRFDIFYAVDTALEKIKGVKEYKKIKDSIIFNQIFLMFLYVLPKEKNIFKLIKYLRKFYDLSKKYELNRNEFIISFVNSQGTKHKIYYKVLLKLMSHGFVILSSVLIFIFKLLRKLLYKKAIKDDVTIDDLIKLSQKQNTMKNSSVKLSVVIPNYNYSKYLYQRLYSVLNQKEKIYEIIILDDCSKDDSRQIIDFTCNELSKYINIKKVYNEENSGSAFKQWEKGFNLATGNYVWIAEADDYCDKQFLNNILKPIKKDNNIVISYSDTAFIDSLGNIILRSIKHEIDIMKTNHWDNNYINNGIDEFNNYTFLNCTIANVSSAIIKKDNYDEFFKLSKEFKQAGDWLFYANVMQKGKISYINKPLNYYRLHGNNVSSVTKKEAHFNEIKRIHEYYDKTYKLTLKQKKEIDKRYKFLIKVWNLDKTERGNTDDK